MEFASPTRDTEQWEQFTRNRGLAAATVRSVKARRRQEWLARAAELKRQLQEQEHKRALAIMRSRRVPSHIKDLIVEICADAGASLADVISEMRFRDVRVVRNEIIYVIRSTYPRYSFPRIAVWFGKDHTSIMHAIACHARDAGLPPLTNYNLERTATGKRINHTLKAAP